ncbi:3768_t:CDS:10 [Diversispora eburnea]|uniref:Exocyst complex component SEC5 n=1 Tax=Diversispora eburnea TaxID=1213867 RepID=A0A9N9FW11_9GLOM|nr:3768_t:CDS:10 [Diversispora eburnea]
MYRQSIYEQPAEELAILKHYGLDTLYPEVWVEENDNRKSTRFSIIEGPGQPVNGNNTASGDERFSWDDSDPLGLKPNVFWNDPLPPKTNNNQELYENIKEKSQLLVCTKSFYPKLFLRRVHKDTPYDDLAIGAQTLRYTLDQKSEALRNLVQDNFDRFVSAKTTIDTVYGEMKAKSLNKESEYGVKGLDNALSADQLFGPVLANRKKAEKIRSTLSLLEKYKFFFNLPIIREYKKGKIVLESTMSTTSTNNNTESTTVTSSTTATSDNNSIERETTEDTALAAQYRKVFDKVWAEIEKIMEEMKDQLFKQLTEHWRSMEEQEKIINILLELDTVEDPVWHYLDSQYKYIIDLLKESYSEQLDKIIALKKSLQVTSADPKELALPSKDMDVQIWKATLEIVKSLSDLLLRCLPDFWKLSKSFIEGKFQKTPTILSANRRRRQAMDLRKVEQCQNMAKGVIDLYASLLSEFFNLIPPSSTYSYSYLSSPALLSPLPQDTNSNNNADNYLLSFVPPQSDSVTSCYFLTKVLHEMSECVNDINAINMSADASGALFALMEKTRWKFVEIICDAWNSDAKSFYLLEDWTLDQDNREITNFLRNFHIFHKYNSRCAYKIASLDYVSDKDDSKGSSKITDVYLKKIKAAFLDSLYSYLDGLVHLVFSEYVPLEPSSDKESIDIIHKSRIDPTSMDSRILLTVSNLSNLKQMMIPRIVSQFEGAYKCNMSEDTQTLNDVVDQLDGILFEDYIKRKTEIVRDIVINGITSGEINWYSISKPTALLSLVFVHAEISDITKPLVNRALSVLLENMALNCLEAFQKVEKFGMGGMLQATLEIEFMHQTLSQYVTPQAQETLQLIYTTIEQLYDTSQESGNLESELGSVKQLLVESRKNTSLQFLCFKKPK